MYLYLLQMYFIYISCPSIVLHNKVGTAATSAQKIPSSGYLQVINMQIQSHGRAISG
jgi:hypothetical protein